MVCKNHPQVNARRHCFQCKKPICPACQEKAYHHIFCGSECIAVYAKQEAGAGELKELLSSFDKGLNEDLREYGDAIVEELREHLTQATSALAKAIDDVRVRVDGSDHGLSEQLRQRTQELTQLLQSVDRRLREEVDRQGDYRQVLKDTVSHARQASDRQFQSARRDILKLARMGRRLTKRSQTQQHQSAQELKSELINIEKQAQTERSRHDQKLADLLALGATVQSDLKDQCRQIKELSTHLDGQLHQELAHVTDQINKLHARLLESQDIHSQSLQERIAKLDERFTRMDEEVERRSRALTQRLGELEQEDSRRALAFSDRLSQLERALETHTEQNLKALKLHQDEITEALHRVQTDLSHSWNELTTAATSGSESAGLTLQKQLNQQLSEGLNKLSSEHHQAFKELVSTLREGIQKRLGQVLSPWTGKVGLLLSGVTLTCVLAIGGFVMWPMSRSVGDPVNSLSHSAVHGGGQSHAHSVSEENMMLPIEDLRGRIDQLGEQLQTLLKSPRIAPSSVVSSWGKLKHTARGNTRRKEYAFTFDGGSNARAAVEILDILKQRQLRTTMFLTGAFIENHPDIVRRMAQDGHEAANHLLAHEHMIDPETKKPLYSRERLLEELRVVEDAYLRITGQPMLKIWRAPFGELHPTALNWASEEGYLHVGWTRSRRMSLDTLDWVIDKKSPLYRSPQGIMDHLLKFEETDPHGLNGAIILMHLGSEREPEDMAHLKLPQMIDTLAKKGYQIKPVSKIL